MSTKNLNTNTLCGIISNSLKMEITQHPPTNERINKISVIYTVEYYSAIKRSEEQIYDNVPGGYSDSKKELRKRAKG